MPAAEARSESGTTPSWGHVAYPWRAAIGLGSRHPSRFYAALISQSLRFGLPASRRFGPLLALLGRRSLPLAPLAAGLRTFVRRGERPDLDALVAAVGERWPELAGEHDGLPAEPPPLSALALQRRAALTLFLFGEEAAPLLVLKVPAPGEGRVEHEVSALRLVGPARLGPRVLGRVGDGWAQEALLGAPLPVEPLSPERARTLEWPDRLEQLTQALTRLGAVTRRRDSPDELSGPIERALADGPISSRARRLLSAALRDLGRLDVAVLRHGDTSPQNCLFAGDRFVGLVDWEYAAPLGVPAYDSLNAGLAYLDQGVGLKRWSEDLVVECFGHAWSGPFGEGTRRAGRLAAAHAGVPEDLLEALELSVFGWRVGRRMDYPSFYPTSAHASARMLELVARG